MTVVPNLKSLSAPALAAARRMARFRRRLAQDRSGLALVEFAFSAPIMLTLGMLGTETANYVITHMKVSQIAIQVADEASRLGEDEVLGNPRIYETDINETLVGAEKLGASLDIYAKGRVVVMSLQRSSFGNRPFIAWERCRGAKNYYPTGVRRGNIDQGIDTVMGIGERGGVEPMAGTAVIFVEVAYDYEPVTPFPLAGDQTIVYTAAFNIRDNRDLGGLYQRNPENPDPVANCWTFSKDPPVT